MATFSKFNQFVEDLATAKHDFSSHTFKLMLSNTAPSASNAVKADITDISSGNGYSAGGNSLTIASVAQTSGTLKVTITDTTFTASGGSIGPFRYFVLYNDTQSTPAKPLVGWYDYGTSITLNSGEAILIDFDGTAGVLTVS